jgi:type IX secretion system PorP/SprF family membrane protein
MKKALLFVLSLFSYVLTNAQETPRSTQYIFNGILFNPAVTGIENYIDAKIGYRKQWAGLEGSPTTQYVSIHAPIGDNYVRSSINSFSSEGNNPMSRSFVNTYTAAEPHHGIGLYAINDKAGRIKNTMFNASYAYHLGLNNYLNLSVGAAGGFSSLNIDVDNIIAERTDDPLFTADNNNLLRPDVSAGVWLYSAQFFVGISGKKVFGKTAYLMNNQRIETAYQKAVFYGSAGYKFFLDEEIAVIPSALVSYWSNAPLAFDANVKLAFRDKFWLGTGLRNNDSYSILAGVNFSHLINISYSYDISTSPIRNSSSGSHEIVLGFLLNNRYRVTCPSF